ncbi:hypothetical protein VPH35_052241 [Triticum aestivum]
MLLLACSASGFVHFLFYLSTAFFSFLCVVMDISFDCVYIQDLAQSFVLFWLMLAACVIEHMVFCLLNHLCVVVFILSLIMCVCTTEVVLIDIKVFMYCSYLTLSNHNLQGTLGVNYNFPSRKRFVCRIG